MIRSRPSLLLLQAALLSMSSLCAQQNTWLQHQPVTSPSPRFPGQMAYDSHREKLVLFGGWDGATALGGTWEFDGHNWTQFFPPVSPPARHAHCLAYDPIQRKTVLFGGSNGSGVSAGYFNDTWCWDGTTMTWTEMTPGPGAPPQPLTRSHTSMAFFPPRNTIVLYGGQRNTSNGAQFFADMWEWDCLNSSWVQIVTSTPWPGLRSQMGLAFDPMNNSLVLAGGVSYSPPGSATYHNDVWEYRLTSGSSPTWAWFSAPSFGGTERAGIGFAWAPNLQALVMYGGYNSSTYLSECKAYDGVSWSTISTPPGLQPTASPGMVEDKTLERVVLFGGRGGGSGGALLNDLWTLGDLDAAAADPQGQGCSSSGTPPVLSAQGLPWIDEVFGINLSVPPGTCSPILFVGQPATTPINLMPGAASPCLVYLDITQALLPIPLIPSGGNASLSLPLTGVPPGLSFQLQGILSEPCGAQGGFALSNGLLLMTN